MLALTPCLAPQIRPPRERSSDSDTRLPNGKPQQDEILKADHERDLKDAAQLIELSQQLKQELERTTGMCCPSPA